MEAAAVGIGFLLDFVIGDPESWWHPVRGIGWLIGWLERLLIKCFPESPTGEIAAGGILAVLVLIVTGGTTAGILAVAGWIHPALRFLILCVMSWQILAARSLKTESMKVLKALKEEDVEKAREAVSRIVGRDTRPLSEEGIIKAAVETVAENVSDGVIAPLFYLLFLGPVGGWMYKAVNTMDSMMGYKNEKYLYLGRAAARLDDLCNYLPARITAGFLILSAFLLGYDGKQAFRIYCRDRYQHASPNSAHGEAAVAGALGIRLAGPAWYFGVLHNKPFIGDPGRDVEPEDIRRAGKMMFTAEALAVAVILAGNLKIA